MREVFTHFQGVSPHCLDACPSPAGQARHTRQIALLHFLVRVNFIAKVSYAKTFTRGRKISLWLILTQIWTILYHSAFGTALSISFVGEAFSAESPSLSIFPDGAAHAPAGIAQYKGLFDRYRFRPPWKVAGVDYYVGVPAALALKDPNIAGILPDGVELDAATRVIVVSASNVTIEGFDFSGQGGNGLYIRPGVSGTKITKNYFQASSSTAPIAINIAAGASDTYVAYNTIDGGGESGNLTFGEMIFNLGNGLTVEYNWIKNTPARFVSTNGGRLSYQYNLIQNGGWSKGIHLNYLQFGSGYSASPRVRFNTALQGRTIEGGEGFQMYVNFAGSISDGEISNNTMISSGSALARISTVPAISFWIHAGSNTQYPSEATGSIHDNYLDISSAYGAIYSGTKGFRSYDNINLRNGAHF